MNLWKASYILGREEIKPKEIVLLVVASVVGALTSVLFNTGINTYGLSLISVAILLILIVSIMPFIIFPIMVLIINIFFKD